MPSDMEKRLKLVVSEDRLQAWVQLEGLGAPGFAPPTPEEIIGVLEQAKIAVDDDVRARVDQIVVACAATPDDGSQSAVPDKFLVAEGRLAVDAVDGRFEWSSDVQALDVTPDEEARQVDYFSRSAIVTVAQGAVFGRVLPPQQGTSLRDVFGKERPPKKPHGTPLKLGPGVQLAEEGAPEVVAAAAGRVAVRGGNVRIYEVLEIPGDVDFASGSVDACVDVAVTGTVRSKFHVHTTKSLTVGRVIEAADIKVDGDVTVGGGVFGQDGTGQLRAGGEVTATLLNEARVTAGGDVRFVKEIINSRVRAGGHLIGERGTIIGGEVYAREGVEARVLGSPANVVTAVTVGIEADTLRRGRRLEQEARESRKAAGQIRKTIEPLTANMKRLSPAQRERATELLSKADEVESQVEELQGEGEELLRDGAAKGSAYVLIHDRAYPRVRIVIDAREVQLQQPLPGPVKVVLRKVNDVTEVVAVNQRTASTTVLPSILADLDASPEDEDQARGEQDDGSDQ